MLQKKKLDEKPIKPSLIRRPAADNRAINEAIELIMKQKIQ